MRTYETTFIINPQTDDATIDKYVNDVAEIIKSCDGEIIHQENMGTRRLAYEIKGLTQGFYANFIYNSTADVLPLLDKHFKQNEVYLRNLTVRIEGDPQEVIKPIDVLGKPMERGDRDDRRGYRNRYDDDRPSDRRGDNDERRERREAKEEAKEVTPSESPVKTGREPAAAETDSAESFGHEEEKNDE